MTREEYARYLDVLVDEHQGRLDSALVSLESVIEDGLAELPTRDGRLFDLAAAVQYRIGLNQSIDDEFLVVVDELIRQYDEIGVNFRDTLAEVNNLVEPIEALPEIERQLKTMTFQGFQDVAYTFRDTISEELYQSTLAGRSASESIRNIRQRVNGVYIRSDDDEIARLVEIAKAGGEDGERAAVKLRTLYASDRAGNSLRRYAYQMVQDSIMQHSASITVETAKQIGAEEYEYFGTAVDDTRDWCLSHMGKSYDRETIEELWEENNWAGKAPGDPFIVRGGYNCRHHWMPLVDGE